MKPYVELAYVGQFGAETDFHTDDYRFTGQNINGGNARLVIKVKFSEKWRANTHINTEFGHDVGNKVNTYIENISFELVVIRHQSDKVHIHVLM